MDSIQRQSMARIGEWLNSAPTRMTLSFALRGALAMLVPFVVLLSLGQPAGGVFAAIGGLYAILAGAAGAYQNRIIAMLMALGFGAISVFLGATVVQSVWLVPLLLAVVAFFAGMARVFGGAGRTLGLSASIMFLVGTFASGPPAQAAMAAGFYALGAAWVVVFQVALWWLRPYRLLLHEVAACFDACADLLGVLENAAAGARPAITRKRVRIHYQRTREAIRSAEATYEAVRVGAGHSSVFFERIAVLLAGVSREVVAAMRLRLVEWPHYQSESGQQWQAFLGAWRDALDASADCVLRRRGAVMDVTVLRATYNELDAQHALPHSAHAPLLLALAHLEGMADIAHRLPRLRFSLHESLPRLNGRGLVGALRTGWAHCTFESIIFRHALRVAVAAGLGMWLAKFAHIPHPLWLPMTVLLVLQPEFGATWRRMGERISGTLVGVLIAGVLHFLLHGQTAEIVVIAVFAFGTFYYIRSHYGVGVVMLTPMILLLLGVLEPQASGVLIVARGLDTLLGGALALLAAYFLWPQWQRTAYIPQCAKALVALRQYLSTTLALAGDGQLSHAELMTIRHEAEREIDNANATLRRMLSEPYRRPTEVRAALGVMAYLQRAAAHTTHIALAVGGVSLTEAEQAAGAALVSRCDVLVDALEHNRLPDSLVALREPLGIDDVSGDMVAELRRLGVDLAMMAQAARRLLATVERTPDHHDLAVL